jgi:L-asparaginase
MAVVVISTGGTIASTSSPDDNGASPELRSDDIVEAVPEVGELTTVKTRDFSNVPSPHFTVDQMLSLTELVRKYDRDPTVEGVVVTQGTDVLEESAYFVDLCYDGSTSVVFTGAMRNPSLPSTDGPMNLLASVRTAIDARARDKGVLVVFSNRIVAAREATKTHSMNVDTFESPEFGLLGTIDENRVTWRRDSVNPDPTLDPSRDALTNDVFALTLTVDMPATHVTTAMESEAVCLATTGAGHIPPEIIEPIGELRDQRVPVVVTTRCPKGRLGRNTYNFPGSEATLLELECYYSDLNLQKTRIRTIVAMAAGELGVAFEQPSEERD